MAESDQYSFMDILDKSLQDQQYELFDEEENDRHNR